jgi:hypothetical protein
MADAKLKTYWAWFSKHMTPVELRATSVHQARKRAETYERSGLYGTLQHVGRADGRAPAMHADKRKKDMSTRAFLARRARGARTRVGSRYRDPRNGQFV